MPFLEDLISRLAAVGGQPAALGVMLTAGVLLAARDWRLSIAALAAQYVLSVALFAQVLPLQVAGVKLMAGLINCGILLLSARQAQALAAQRSQAAIGPEQARLMTVRGSILPAGLPFRLIAALIVGLTAWGLAGRPESALPEVSADVSLAVYALGAMGLLLIALTEAPLPIGIGLLTLLTAFEMFYHAVEPSLSIIALLAFAHFGIALVSGYLTIVEAGR